MIFAPIPNLPFVIASGLIWGTGYGIIYAVLGQLIGSALAFAISRKFGRRYVPAIIGEKNAQKVRYKDRFGGLPGIAKRLREYLED